MKTKKKLIEVALPLDLVNTEASRRKRKAPAGYPTSLHKWWAQRPLAAARAVIFAQMVDDPSSNPDLFPTEKAQEKERRRLFGILEELVKWENTNNAEVLAQARAEIWQSWRRACAENVDHPFAKKLFDRYKLPDFYDPFAGSGALPLEAQRLGLQVVASDLNPVSVLITKAMIEVPPRFARQPPVNPTSRAKKTLLRKEWRGASGLADDVRYYGKWMRDEAQRRIGHLYPKIKVTPEMVNERQDLKHETGRELDVVAWLWARTVKSPNPAVADVAVPLVPNFMLSTKKGKEAYVEPVIADGGYKFTVKGGKPKNASAKRGTKSGGSHSIFLCLMSGEQTPMPFEYLREEGKAGRMNSRLMAIVAQGQRGRIYLPPNQEMEDVSREAIPAWTPETPLYGKCRVNVSLYGFDTFGDLFTPRQLVALTTFSELVSEARERAYKDALAASLLSDNKSFAEGGTGARAYADAVSVYLSIAVSRLADYGSSVATWRPKDGAMRSSLPKQAVQMTWDYAEGSPFGRSSSGFIPCVEVVSKVIETSLQCETTGLSLQKDAAASDASNSSFSPVISTDPPYFNNVGYADLSDFFYVWLRHSQRLLFPDLFATLAVPKAEELVATPYRHGGKEQAESFFLEGMTKAMDNLAHKAHPAFPVTIYYAFKQSESKRDEGVASTGWETFLGAVIRAGFSISGTWPMRTEGDNRQVGIGSNALASSIVLVCRPQSENAATTSRREFTAALRAELPTALAHLQKSNIAPVDLTQAAIGPGMAVFTRYVQILESDGSPLSVRKALALINQVLDEVLAKQEGDFDADTRWALAWFEENGLSEGEYGKAETLSIAKNTSVAGLVEAGVLASRAGKVRLLAPAELPEEWDPATDQRLTVWEMVHHLIRLLEADGESAAAELAAKLGSHAETARELAYRLYSICERKKRATEALAYNALVKSWPEISRLAHEAPHAPAEKEPLFSKLEN